MTAATQKFLDIAEIKSDCVVLNDGSLRAVILVSSINFALKSEEEQEALISGYVSFLNSLDYPLQIVIQSRKLDIESYLTDLQQKRRDQENDLLKSQMADYIDYVKELIELGEIMTKRFYAVVPYNPVTRSATKGFFDRMGEVFSPASIVKLNRKKFEEYRENLFKRVDNVIGGLSGIGLKAAALDTQSLIELYYNSYNPEISAQEKMQDTSKLDIKKMQ